MAHRVLFICLALTAMLGLASATEPATATGAPTTSPSFSSSSSAFAPVFNSAIHNTDNGSGNGKGDDTLIAALVGGPVPAGAFPSTLDGPALAPSNSGASRISVSTSVTVTTMIGRFF